VVPQIKEPMIKRAAPFIGFLCIKSSSFY